MSTKRYTFTYKLKSIYRSAMMGRHCVYITSCTSLLKNYNLQYYISIGDFSKMNEITFTRVLNVVPIDEIIPPWK